MTHALLPEEQRARLGITNNLIRLSIGLENVDDLVEDLDQALKVVSNPCLSHTIDRNCYFIDYCYM